MSEAPEVPRALTEERERLVQFFKAAIGEDDESHPIAWCLPVFPAVLHPDSEY